MCCSGGTLSAASRHGVACLGHVPPCAARRRRARRARCALGCEGRTRACCSAQQLLLRWASGSRVAPAVGRRPRDHRSRPPPLREPPARRTTLPQPLTPPRLARSRCCPQPPKGKGKAAAPVPAAVKKPAAAAAAKSSNPLLEEKRPKSFGARHAPHRRPAGAHPICNRAGIGGALPPKTPLNRYVKWPK